MRATKLVMSSFLTYAGKVEINLDALGTCGLYLITGDTGAGKTTIFDGITYALYGQASGETREESMLRSKYSKDDTPTFVELDFIVRDKTYKIYRSPEYEKPKQRGSGYTTQKKEVLLTLPSGETISKEADVSEKIKEIIGVNKEQFCQIAMIAQGNFLKLLNADTKERIKIFREIFKTDNYQKLQLLLKEEYSTILKSYEKEKNSVNQYIQGVICSNEALKSKLELAILNKLAKEEILPLIQNVISQDQLLEEKIQNDLTSTEQDLIKINQDLAKLSEQEKQEKELQENQKLLQRLKLDLQGFITVFNQEEKNLLFCETHKIEIAKLQSEVQEYDKLTTLQKEQNLLQEEFNSKSILLKDKQTLIEETKKSITNLKTTLESITDANESLQIKQNQKDNLLKKHKELKDFCKLISDCNDLQQKLTKQQLDYKQKESLYKLATAKFTALQHDYLSAQAGILAENLLDGEPCPVCGALSHPNKAKKPTTTPSKQLLEEAEIQQQTAQSNMIASSTDAASINGRILSLKQSIFSSAQDFNFGNQEELFLDKANALLLEITKQGQELATKIQEQEKKILQKKQLETQIPLKEQQLGDLLELTAKLGERISFIKATLEQQNKTILELKQKLVYPDQESANKRLTQLQQSVKLSQEKHKKALEDKNTCQENVAKVLGKISQIEQSKTAFGVFDKQDLQNKLKDLEQKKILQTKELQNVKSTISANETALKNVAEKFAQISKVEQKYTIIKALYDTANGQVVGKEKIMLETYVLTTYFDRIISRANLRLMIMSGGQYELKRKLVADNSRSQSGLDLDVIDHYNGSIRSVKSLSGGESFKASLSLALGLSDEVQSSAGGIKLDSLFVDEGFGSLDDESLRQAISALNSLAQGNRLVGIISHVNELKEKIDKQILVTKNLSLGSKVEVIT